VDQIYAFSPSGPEVATSIGFARNDHSQLNQSCVRSDAQIRRLKGPCAGLLIMVACCLVFDLSGYGYLANASGRPMPTASSTPSCNKASITGVRSDNCTGLQTAAAARGSQSVSLAANPAFTSTVTGLLNGDTMMTTYGNVATISSTVGTSLIATAISDPVAANYAPIIRPAF
jgi:hypothetical protein